MGLPGTEWGLFSGKLSESKAKTLPMIRCERLGGKWQKLFCLRLSDAAAEAATTMLWKKSDTNQEN
jgi:hypothetical protein